MEKRSEYFSRFNLLKMDIFREGEGAIFISVYISVFNNSTPCTCFNALENNEVRQIISFCCCILKNLIVLVVLVCVICICLDLVFGGRN
jgi:hypothetical protein